MKIGTSRTRRTLSIGAAGVLMAALAACTGRGGGTLPPHSPAFNAQGTFGFTFSCQDSGGINSQTGKLQLQLDYTEHGTTLVGAPFSVHGIVDQLDPTLESALCIGQNPPPPPLPPNHLIFLGRYRPTSTAPAGFPSTCKTSTTAVCRFEVQVTDNDGNRAPSAGDSFSIKLSGDTTVCLATDVYSAIPCSQLAAGSVFYTRGGTLSGGNITVN